MFFFKIFYIIYIICFKYNILYILKKIKMFVWRHFTVIIYHDPVEASLPLPNQCITSLIDIYIILRYIGVNLSHNESEKYLL